MSGHDAQRPEARVERREDTAWEFPSVVYDYEAVGVATERYHRNDFDTELFRSELAILLSGYKTT